MEEEEEEQAVAATQFPPLPEYYKSYGPGDNVPHPMAVSLEPPKPPARHYRCFGDMWDPEEKKRSLKEEGREQLFEEGAAVGKEVDRLCGLAISKYQEFLSALGDMDEPAAKTKERAEEFETIFINLLYLVNQLRPAQGRELLIGMLRAQVERRRATAAKLNALVEASEKSIDEAFAAAAARAPADQDAEMAAAPPAGDAPRSPAGDDAPPPLANVFDLLQE